MAQVDHNTELVTAQASDRILTAHTGFKAGRDDAQYRIAHGMAQRVVDVLEMVQVKKQQGPTQVMTVEQRGLLAQTVHQQGTIGQIGQWVMVGQVPDLRLSNLELADVAVARKDDAGAERLYQQALRLDSTNSSAVRGLVNIYQRQSPEKAMAYLDQLPRSQRKTMQSAINSIQSDVLQQQAQALEQQQQWAGAADKLQQALKLSPNDVWLTYRLAKDLHAAGRTDEADRTFTALAQQLPGDPQQVYAHALYLSGTDRDRAALAQVNGLPQAKWDANIRELSDRLHFSETLKKAQDLRDAGHEDEAIAYLRQQPANTRVDLTLADWALEREDYDAALAGYRDVLKREPDNDSAHLGEIEAFVAQGELEQARTQLQALQQVKPTEAPSMNTERRVAGAWASVGDMAKAQAIFDRITPQAAKEPGQDGALVMRDAQ